MLPIADRELAAAATAVLAEIQSIIDAAPDYQARVESAKIQWSQKNSTHAKAVAFSTIRSTLAEMCIGPVRCAYCEDSLADEIEHILPKNLFPDHAFTWSNYLYACGPCNGPKSDRYGVLKGNEVVEFIRRRGRIAGPPPVGVSGFINPRAEDPLSFFELEMGGISRTGESIDGTFELLPADGLTRHDYSRARFTIDVLGLNREIIRVARINAYGGFRARLKEYVECKEHGNLQETLGRLKQDILSTPHLTVFAEMRRQRSHLPDIDNLIDRAPEIMTWSLVRRE